MMKPTSVVTKYNFNATKKIFVSIIYSVETQTCNHNLDIILIAQLIFCMWVHYAYIIKTKWEIRVNWLTLDGRSGESLIKIIPSWQTYLIWSEIDNSVRAMMELSVKTRNNFRKVGKKKSSTAWIWMKLLSEKTWNFANWMNSDKSL